MNPIRPVLDLADADAARDALAFFAAIPGADAPPRLAGASPASAYAWYLRNLVGRRLSVRIGDVPLSVTFREGHFFRLVCKTPPKGRDGSRPRKGFVTRAASAEDARRMILSGEVGAEEVAGYETSRARLLPLVPGIVEAPDMVLCDTANADFLTFAKRYGDAGGLGNILIFEVNRDGSTLGPLTAHPRRIDAAFLKGKSLVAVSGAEGLGNLATFRLGRVPVVARDAAGEDSRGEAPANAATIAHTGPAVNPGAGTVEE